MQYPDDHFLTDVTTLGQTDRAILDSGFERNGLLVHVLAESRPARLDADGLCGLPADVNRARRSKRIGQGWRGGDNSLALLCDLGVVPWVSACVAAGTVAVTPVVMRLSAPAVNAVRRLGLGLKETSFSAGPVAYGGARAVTRWQSVVPSAYASCVHGSA